MESVKGYRAQQLRHSAEIAGAAFAVVGDEPEAGIVAPAPRARNLMILVIGALAALALLIAMLR